MAGINKNENLDMCRLCGGVCCLKSGCDYSANDFKDCSYNTLTKELAKGNISIVCFIKFKNDGTYEPILYLRARNTNRDIVDLVSLKTRCSMLSDNGCVYDYKNRPFGGKNLIPRKHIDEMCMYDLEPLKIVMSWKPYQKILKRIVLEYTGLNVDKKIRLDVENFFYDILIQNYEFVSISEREEVKDFVILLGSTFKEELARANQRYNSRYSRVLNNK